MSHVARLVTIALGNVRPAFEFSVGHG